VTLPLSSHGKLAGGSGSCRDARQKVETTSRGQLINVRTKGQQTILGGCHAQCMLYFVYAVLGVRCTRCMLYSGYAVLGVCVTAGLVDPHGV